MCVAPVNDSRLAAGRGEHGPLSDADLAASSATAWQLQRIVRRQFAWLPQQDRIWLDDWRLPEDPHAGAT